MTQCYYHQDHLGNICAVWDATHGDTKEKIKRDIIDELRNED